MESERQSPLSHVPIAPPVRATRHPGLPACLFRLRREISQQPGMETPQRLENRRDEL
jgi:hypothetical protein